MHWESLYVAVYVNRYMLRILLPCTCLCNRGRVFRWSVCLAVCMFMARSRASLTPVNRSCKKSGCTCSTYASSHTDGRKTAISDVDERRTAIFNNIYIYWRYETHNKSLVTITYSFVESHGGGRQNARGKQSMRISWRCNSGVEHENVDDQQWHSLARRG